MSTTLKDLFAAARHFWGLRKEVEKITSTINPIEVVTPLDFGKTKAEWIEKAKNGLFTNPVFHYNETYLSDIIQVRYNLETLLKRLKGIDADNSAEAFYLDYLEEVVSDSILTTEMARAMLAKDHRDLARVVLEKYGEASTELVHYAESSARTGFTKKTGVELNDDIQKLREAKFDATLIAELFRWTMEQYRRVSQQNIPIWPIEISDCSAIDVRDKSSYGYPLVAIPQTREVSGIKLAELIGHEIECHWRNSQNATFLGLPKLDDETVYEGVAKLKDYRFNERYNTEVSAPIPYYVLAQKYARAGGSFAETASYLTNNYGLAPKKSWVYTYRTFRGASDMNNSAGYAFTKDRAYLEGFLYVQRVGKNPELRSFLNFGTLSVKWLEKLATILSREEVEANTLPDLDFQNESIWQILNRI